MNPDRLAELEDERRFLLRSLRDLDAERAVGDVDEADYETLRDGYTKRAADVLRDIEEGKAALPRPGGRRWVGRLVAVAVVVLVAGTAGWLVARSSGQRLGDETITGGAPSDDVAVLLARARSLLGTDPAGAQALYEQVLAERPEQPEALTYSGWLLCVASNGASADLPAAAVATTPSASGTSSTQIDALRQSGGVSTSVPRRAKAWTRSGMTSPWLHSTAPSGTSVSRARTSSRAAPSARRGSRTTSSPWSRASGSTVCTHRAAGLDHTPVIAWSVNWRAISSDCRRPDLVSGRSASSPSKS